MFTSEDIHQGFGCIVDGRGNPGQAAVGPLLSRARTSVHGDAGLQGVGGWLQSRRKAVLRTGGRARCAGIRYGNSPRRLIVAQGVVGTELKQHIGPAGVARCEHSSQCAERGLLMTEGRPRGRRVNRAGFVRLGAGAEHRQRPKRRFQESAGCANS